jgi:NAD kinase
MPNEFKRIGLWGRFSENNVAEPAAQLADHLQSRGVEVYAATGEGTLNGSSSIHFLPQSELGSSVDLLVAIGGDGNLLRATRCVAGCRVPLMRWGRVCSTSTRFG